MLHSNHWCSWPVLDKYRDLKFSGWFKWIRYFLFHLESTKASLEEDANVTNIFQTVILQHRWTESFQPQSNALDTSTDDDSKPQWLVVICNHQRLGQAGSHLWEKGSGVSICPWPMCTDMLSDISLTLPQHSRNEQMMWWWVCLPQSGRHHIGILFHSNKTGIFCYTEAWVPVKRKTAKESDWFGGRGRHHVPCPHANSSVELQQCSHLD